MEIGTIGNAGARASVPSTVSGELGADDFLELLVTQLTHQDPLDPTSNEDLLAQLSSIRDIQLSTTLVDSMETLTGSQRYASAATLIGKWVTGTIGDESTGVDEVEGVVTAVRFDASGRVTLELDGGEVMEMDRLRTVTDGADAGGAPAVESGRRERSRPVSLLDGIAAAFSGGR